MLYEVITNFLDATVIQPFDDITADESCATCDNNHCIHLLFCISFQFLNCIDGASR